MAKEIVKINIDIFIDSGSYQSGRENAEKHIRPIIQIMTDEDIKYLLEQILEEQGKRCQLIDCQFVLKELFQETINTYPHTLSLWKNFYESLDWLRKEELKQMIDNFPELKQLKTEPF
ncbi:hypothetical protein [Dapis sp. BLCC M229]|uniref:hypothetical protein n=1 Tax=Dapis sp. BLCC M229 TaxID=3400188 RepID=UPI003CF78333